MEQKTKKGGRRTDQGSVSEKNIPANCLSAKHTSAKRLSRVNKLHERAIILHTALLVVLSVTFPLMCVCTPYKKVR